VPDRPEGRDRQVENEASSEEAQSGFKKRDK
jgi:hypothetical protein